MAVIPIRASIRPVAAPARRPDMPLLGACLVGRGLVDAETLGWALERQSRHNARLGEILVAHGHIDQADLSATLAEQYQAPILAGAEIAADARLVDRLGLAFCVRGRLVPMRSVGGATLVAVARPEAFPALKDAIEAAIGPVMPAVAEADGIDAALARIRRVALTRRAESRTPDALSCRPKREGRACALPRMSVAMPSFVAAAMGVSAVVAPSTAFTALALVALAVVAAQTAFLAAILAVPGPRPDGGDASADLAIARLPRVSILVPVFRERDIAGTLVRRLSRLDYPRELLEICLVTEDADAVTREALARSDLPPWMKIVSVPRGGVTTKPRALNYALDHCTGDFVGVYDAEDAPPADQIHRMVRQFYAGPAEVACLQGRLNFYNPGCNWITRCFAVEYATWFRVVLPGLARLGWAVPLGGTTLFFRRGVLEDLGAWDAHNVTEDADLGLRLARRGYRTGLLDSTTLEEATCKAVPWIRQRSRWLKGYAITYLVHMRDPAALWRDLGAWRFLGVQVLFLGTVLGFTLAPILWSFWLLLLGLPHPWAGALGPWQEAGLVALLAGSGLIGAATQIVGLLRSGQRRLGWVVPTLQLYFMMASAAMLKGLLETATRPYFWDKTAHGHSLGAADRGV